MLEIDSKGLLVDLEQDNVGELTAKFQWIAKQPLIDPKYIEVFGVYDLSENNDHQ